jgi:hypothetical protein
MLYKVHVTCLYVYWVLKTDDGPPVHEACPSMFPGWRVFQHTNGLVVVHGDLFVVTWRGEFATNFLALDKRLPFSSALELDLAFFAVPFHVISFSVTYDQYTFP